ncbi:MAG: phospholipase [Pirellulaceae bacterium]|nr:phospholipase [Pirellulaceae bacterium]
MSKTVLSTYEKQVFLSAAGPLPYRIRRPQLPAAGTATDRELSNVHEARFPLLLFLHGAGERGTDNEATLVHGAKDFAGPKLQMTHPSFVVVPQCPADDVWASIERTHEPTTLSPQPSAALQAVQQLIGSLLSELPIDRERVYLTGLSMGGYGGWDLLMREPDLYTAAVLICGGADCHYAGLSKLARKPLWVFHGDQDDVVPVTRSREIVTQLREQGGAPRYTEYVGGDHDSWTATYGNHEVLEWLFTQRRFG